MAVLAWPAAVLAQQAGVPLPPVQGAPAAGAPPKAAKPSAGSPAAKPSKAPAEGASGGSEAGLRQRVEQLEEQLVDMQVLVGTLETLAKSSGASSASPTFRAGGGGGGASDGARVEGLESQVRSLTTQVQQLSEQVRGLGGQPRATAAASPASPRDSWSPAPALGPAAATAARSADGIDGLLAGQSAGSMAAGGPSDISSSALPPPGGAGEGNPKQVYETAYGYLLQQDYGAAEAAFDDFLKRYPNDPLAGNAQFWLGESYFVRAQYKPAAGAFLKGYQSYGRSAKAPDSLLKLAMSLGRLGQKDNACASFNELNVRFPQASADVKSRAATERQRTGCP
jgi:tol-pal system protein YbgF